MVPTALAVLLPRPFLAPDAVRPLDVEAGTRRFDWERDGWLGALDTLTPVAETADAERGDCEDYAFVAASWALAHGRDGVGVAVCFDPLPSHVVAFDDERVYSTGEGIVRGSGGDYLAATEYRWALRRRL
ncbi:MAG: hypothetical protein ABEJ42_09130 [Halobacteriaceae archaeon]